MSELTNTVDQQEAVKIEAVEQDQDDFLAGVQAADAESFNVCISCD